MKGPFSDTISLSSTSSSSVGMFNTGMLFKDAIYDNGPFGKGGKTSKTDQFDTASLRSQDDTYR
ncbi:hypothetical protein EON65_08830 [archaeon]|nr:MAG: hypothetical protein EON65_08830 [archaeon]